MHLKNLARKHLPPKLQSWLRRTYYRRPLLRRLYYFPRDAAALLDRSHGLCPPPSLRNVGDGDFEEIGRKFLGHFRGIGGLRPDERVLEIGCGVGRMAIPLTGYLSSAGRYQGFDVVRGEIDWCRRRITPRFPNFLFHFIDVYNGQTNPRGRLRADSFRFPLQDGEADFVFLTSVFTHMLAGDIAHYLKEISRLLNGRGRMLATFFLLNPETRERLERNGSRFRHPYGSSLVTDPAMPEASIAHEEGEIRALLQAHGLRVQEPIHWGAWSGRPDFLSAQDILLAAK